MPEPQDELIAELEAAGFEAVDLTGPDRERDGAIWECKIGMREGTKVRLPGGADAPMRKAVERAFLELTGVEAHFNFSGWGGTLTRGEREVIDGP
jgi:hypothetical protein